MYQRGPALERPISHLFRFLWPPKYVIPGRTGPARALLPEVPQKPSFGTKTRPQGKRYSKGNAMDQPLKSPGQSALDDAFHAMFELSRTRPAPDLAQRLDRLARLRAIVSDNETRFEQAISADFGHRST